MRTKNLLLVNQKLIDAEILQIKPTFIPDNDEASPSYRAKKLWLQELYNTTKKNKFLKLIDYFNLIDALLRELAEQNSSSNKHIEQQIRLDILNYLPALLNKTINVIRPNKSLQEHFETINDYHQKIESSLKEHFNPEFNLSNVLNLAGITKEYNTRYDNEYGQGYLGFFKLPIKRFFQQTTRIEELKFLADIENYCQKNPLLSEEQKNLLKLSGANLVSMKIDTETFGQGSILGKILRIRINESRLPNDLNEMMEGFIEECITNKIKVPKHLNEFYCSRQEIMEPKQSVDF